MKRNLYFHVGHRDIVGGGQLALMNLASALREHFEVYLSSEFHPDMANYEYWPDLAGVKVGQPDRVDVFLASSYAEKIYPLRNAGVNIFYTFFPRHTFDTTFAYDEIVTISAYSARYVRQRWHKMPKVCVGGAFAPAYPCLVPKEKIVMTNGRFFMEGDPDAPAGHSKGHHFVIQAFRQLGECARDWRLVCTGSCITADDSRYLDTCKRLAGGDPRIAFMPMITRDELVNLYGRAKIFAHGMGYGRPDPAETEHYGICVEKAALAGCYTIVHNSGGAPELALQTWDEPNDLRVALERAMMFGIHHEAIALNNRHRTWLTFAERTREAFGKWA